MVYFRIRSKEDRRNIPTHIDLANEFEFYFIIDEMTFPIELQSSSFEINNLIIDSKRYKLEKEELHNGREVVYSAKIPTKSNNQHYRISYDARVLMEKEDIIQLTLDVPTKDVAIEFDYSSIDSEITPYGLESTSFIEKPNMIEENHSITFRYNDWLLPKNSFVFSWWKKDKLA